ARAVEVKRVLPMVDGTRLDDIVDYFTYVVVPALFLLHLDLLPAPVAVPVALCPVVASAVGFSRVDAKTPDHFFTGFPSYWNIVAFYLWALGWPRVANAAVVVAFAIAVFVPIRYVYPSRTRALRPLTIALGLGWGAAVLAVLARPGPPPRAVVLASAREGPPPDVASTPAEAEYALVPRAGGLTLTAATPRALVAAAYALLAAAGCEWSPDGPDGERLPREPARTVPALDGRPAFA